MKVVVYNQEGKEMGATVLPKEIFDVKMNSDLLHQVVVSQMSNRRKSIAHTKDRGDVSGGGKKPWRQKGTGRARHGSIRSPLWKGGGVTFGPKNDKVFKKKINKKIKRKALFIVLSEKLKNNLILVLDKIDLKEPKTKILNNLIKSWRKEIENFKEGSCLFALSNYDEKMILAAGNIKKIKIIEARNLNALDLLSFKYLIMPKESIKTIKEFFINSAEAKKDLNLDVASEELKETGSLAE